MDGLVGVQEGQEEREVEFQAEETQDWERLAERIWLERSRARNWVQCAGVLKDGCRFPC